LQKVQSFVLFMRPCLFSGACLATRQVARVGAKPLHIVQTRPAARRCGSLTLPHRRSDTHKKSAAQRKKIQSKADFFDAMALGAEINEVGLEGKIPSNYQTKKNQPSKI
jgi:hypothetical protein